MKHIKDENILTERQNGGLPNKFSSTKDILQSTEAKDKRQQDEPDAAK